MATHFLDTNVILRHVLGDHPELSPRATAYFRRIERNEVQVRTTDTVLFETVFTMERTYKLAKSEIRDTILPLLQLPGILIPGKRYLEKVFDLYIGLNISFADAYHAVIMERYKLTEIATFDRDFDRIPGISRVQL